MENKPKLSIIIPAHNAEAFLQRCVERIVEEKQGLELEILIVENGSQDGTLELAEALTNQYPFVKLMQSQKGVSNARNAGIEAAQGEWILFQDADDYLAEGAGGVLKRDMEDSATDLFIYSYEKGNSKVSVCDSLEKKVYEQEKIEGCLESMLRNPTRCMAVWGKLFRRELMLKHSLKFKDNLRMAEDSDYLIRYIMNCKKIAFGPEIVYHYSTEATSAMRTYDGKKTEEYVKTLLSTEDSIKTAGNGIKKAYQTYILMHLNILMVREVFCMNNTEPFAVKRNTMKKILNYDIFKNALEKVAFSECKSGRMIPVFLLKCKMYGLCSIVYRMRAKQNQRNEK